MQRRVFLLAGGFALPAAAWAHHGWSSFDTGRPLYLAGKAASVSWRNPHAELVLTLPADLRLPSDLTQRPLPAQTAPVDGPALLAQATLPKRPDRSWTVELAPLTRLQAWKVPEIKPGDALSVVGYAMAQERGEALLRAEYLFIGEQAFGLRSSPA